jgi:hypothetical protein
MTQSEHRGYVHLWTRDRNTFDRWMKACAVVGSIFAAAVLIMALGSSKAPGPQQAAMAGMPGTEISASARHHNQASVSPTELTLQFAPHQLPIQQVNEPF